MSKIIFKYKWHLLGIVVLMIIEPTINSVLNFWLQRLFNAAVPGGEEMYVLRLLVLGFLLWMLKRVVTHTMLLIRDRFISRVKAETKHQMFAKLLNLNTANISQNASGGEHISMFTNDILLLEQRFLNQIMGLISGVFSIAILGYSFVVLNPKLAWAIIGFGVLTVLVPICFSKALNSKNTVYTRKIATFTQRLKEYISSYPTIKNYSIEPEIMERFDSVNNDTEDAKFDADCTFTLANSVGQLMAWFMQFIGVGLGIIMVLQGEILVGTVIAAQAFASDLALPIQNVIICVNSIRSVKNVVKKLESFTESYSAEESTDEAVHHDIPKSCDIEFRSITLKLGEKTIIDDFSYKFEPGKKYLVVGINGAGKSSIFKTLKRWYSSCSGEIFVGGMPISQFSNDELSNIVSYLNEDVSLFSGSVKDNITLFRDYTPEELEKAIQGAHMELDINRQIADEGRNISSGEQRRVEIARSLLKEAPVIIFDEVVSTLDIETAYDIEKSALALPDKTVIFISHNFSGKLIRKYDNILVLSAGKVVASGTYDELIESSPYFQRICNIKFG